MFWDLSRLGSWQRFLGELRDAEEEEAEANLKEGGREGREGRVRVVEAPGWMPARKAPRRTTTTGEGGGGITTTAAANYKTAGSMAGRASGKQLGTGTSTSPDPETLLSAAGAAGAAAGSSGRPGSSSRERPGSRGSTTTTATATATATATQPAASRPPGIGLGGYTQKQLDEWHDQCDITDSHKEIKPHKTVTVDGKGQHFVGRQVAWSPEGNWCVVVGNSNRAMIFQRWGK